MCIDLQQAVQLNNDGVNALVNDNEDVAIAFMADSLKVLQNDMSQTEEAPTLDPATAQSNSQHQQPADCSSNPTESPSPSSSCHTTKTTAAADRSSSPRSTLDDLAENPFVTLSKRHHMFLQQQQQSSNQQSQHQQSHQQQQSPSSVPQQQSPGNPCILLFERAVLIPQSSSNSSCMDDNDAASSAIVQLKDVLVSTVCVLFNVALAHHRKGKKLLGTQQQQCQSQQGQEEAEQQPQDSDSCGSRSSDTDDKMDEDGDGNNDSADDYITKAEKLYRVVLGTDLLATATISSQTTTSDQQQHSANDTNTNTTYLLNNMHNTAIALIVKLACINNLLEIRPDRGMHDLAFEGLVTDVITLLQTSRVVAEHPLFQNPQIQYLLLNVFLLQEFGPHIAPGAA